MASASQSLPSPDATAEAVGCVAAALGNTCYAIVGGAACSVLGSLRVTSDVDFVVPKGQTKAARELLKQARDYFEVEKRTQHTYYKSSPKIEIEILAPPAMFREDFTGSTPVVILGQIKVLKPTLLLNAKCGSILGRTSSLKKDTDAEDINFLLQWCLRNAMIPTAAEVPNATKDFVQQFTSTYGPIEDWINLGYDLKRGRWSK